MLAARSYLGWPLCLVLLSATGCGDDGASGDPLVRGDAGRPGQDDDGSVPEDGGGDAGDAGGDDAGEEPEPDFVSECQGDVTVFPAARVSEGPVFASSVFENQLELVYLEPSCGGTRDSSATHGLMHVSLPSSGDFGDPRALVNLGDACYQTRNPAVVAGVSPTFTFLSNIEGGTELYALQASSGEPTRRSNERDHRLAALTAATFQNKPWVAYTLTPLAQPFPPPLTPPAAIHVAELGGPAATPVVEAASGFHAQRLALSGLGGASAAKVFGALAWASDAPDKLGSYLQFLAADGKAAGEVATLSNNLGSTPSLSIAQREEGGAIAYTILSGDSQQIRFRTLSGQGELGRELSITLGDVEVRELALTAYSIGYALVSRQVSLANNQASIQATFLDEMGKIGRTRLVATTSSTASGLEAHVALDGRLLVVWSDPEVLSGEDATTTTENRVKVARVACP